mmetsp:Transcript_53854/g.130916  ORF Transcript_53854/g.130916 Transcript_53854/m.130916 type:complete len:89 (-) Transcript_53854:210-476(-)
MSQVDTYAITIGDTGSVIDDYDYDSSRTSKEETDSESDSDSDESGCRIPAVRRNRRYGRKKVRKTFLRKSLAWMTQKNSIHLVEVMGE